MSDLWTIYGILLPDLLAGYMRRTLSAVNEPKSVCMFSSLSDTSLGHYETDRLRIHLDSTSSSRTPDGGDKHVVQNKENDTPRAVLVQ